MFRFYSFIINTSIKDRGPFPYDIVALRNNLASVAHIAGIKQAIGHVIRLSFVAENRG